MTYQIVFFSYIKPNIPNILESHDETRIEELHKKRNYLAAYCKLIVYNVIPVQAGADIFKHYLRVSITSEKSA